MMSMFENDQYRWRETYFVLFDSSKRPALKQVKQALSGINDRYMLTNLTADDQGRFDSLTVLSPDDFAALDISYLAGEEVTEQAAEWAQEMTAIGCRKEDRRRLDQLARFDGRFDVLHFEQLTDFDAEDELDEVLDPSALLLVLEALARLTDGVALDPQSGTVF